MKHVFRILPEHKLIVERCGPTFGLEDYIEFKSRQISHPDFRPEYNVLSDLTWTEFSMPASEVQEIASYFKENVPIQVARRGCLLTQEPLQTAYSMLFEKQMKGYSAVSWNVCTTLNEALNWLSHPMSIEELKAVLAELRLEQES